MSRKKKPVYREVEITDIAAEGKAIAKIDDMVVFVPKLIPGDVVDIRVTKKRKNYREGVPVYFHHYSSLRQEPFCKHFFDCGGCKWQHLPYKEQLKFKQRQVEDHFKRIGKVSWQVQHPILEAHATQFYRNKLEFTFSNKRWLTNAEIEKEQDLTKGDALGFHVAGLFDKVLDVEECFLQDERSNEIRNFIRDTAIRENMSFFDIREQHGLLRNLIIRNTSLNEWMVVVVFYEDDKEKRELLMQAVYEHFPWITSLMYVVNPKANDTIFDLDVHLYKGKKTITEKLGERQFIIGPKSFFQTNTQQAFNLYSIVKNLAGLTGEELVYDLYTGTGSIALFIADVSSRVVGLESVEEAIDDARNNAEANQIDNVTFYAGDMKDVLNDQLVQKEGKPDVMVIDPPRAGMHQDVINNILKYAPEKLVYVSCNPATQARDINLLSEVYAVDTLQTVDMFPHTHHVENVALMVRK